MKNYRIKYGVPYVDDLGEGKGQEVFWEHKSFDFPAADDSRAKEWVKHKMESSVVELTLNGEKQRWHNGLFHFEEVARQIEFPELPNNCKQMPLVPA